MKPKQLKELILQSLEHELGGVKVYETAVTCAEKEDLKKEWTKYLAETRTHVTKLEAICESMGIHSAEETPGRVIVRHLGAALVSAMKSALQGGDPMAAELVAAECVTLAETKDHLDWELLSKCAEHVHGDAGKVFKQAAETVEDQEDEHLYHTKGWCRELWIQSLGLKAVLPPPEEVKHVKSAIGAARAEKSAPEKR